MAFPTVSVIIPCFNGHAFLDQAIESARWQTVAPLEILVIDDGSTDKQCIQHLDNLPEDVRLIRQENKGLPGARNTGFREARGDYVLPLDCDDWLEPGFLEQGLTLLRDNPDISFTFAWLKLEAEAGGVLQKNYNFFEQLFLNQLPYCLLQRRKHWQDLGGYDENMRQGYEDWEWNLRLGKHGFHGKAIEAPLFHYRVQASGMLASISRNRHADLWTFIRQKHAGVYTLSSLLKIWRAWRHGPSTRSPVLYFGWDILYRLLPVSAFNMLVAKLFRYSASSGHNLPKSKNT